MSFCGAPQCCGRVNLLPGIWGYLTAPVLSHERMIPSYSCAVSTGGPSHHSTFKLVLPSIKSRKANVTLLLKLLTELKMIPRTVPPQSITEVGFYFCLCLHL